MKRTIKITLNIDEPEIDNHELAGHLVSAIESWGGQYRPEDVFFDTIKVERLIIGKDAFKREEGSQSSWIPLSDRVENENETR